MNLEQHPAFLICVPVVCDANSANRIVRQIEVALDDLDNPARHDVQTALDASGVIHFLSLSVVWDAAGADLPILVADVAGDGTPTSIIAALTESAGGCLLPIYRIACGVDRTEALQTMLKRHWANPTEAAFPIWRRQITGLSFQGTPGLTVAQILEDERIADKARSAVLGYERIGPTTALSYVKAARKATSLNPLWGVKFDPTEMAPGIAITSRSQQIANVFGLLILDWSFLFLVLFAFLYVNIENILYSIVDNHPANPFDMWISVLIAIAIGPFVHLGIKIYRRITNRGKYDPVRPWLLTVSSIVVLLVTLLAFRAVPLAIHPGSIRASGWTLLPIAMWLKSPIALWLAIVLGLLALILFLFLVTGLFLLFLRGRETKDKPCDADPDLTRLEAILRREDRSPQNHMIGISTIRYGFFRRFVSLPLGLYLVGLLVRAGIFRKGFLSKVGSIHFAQWACIPSWAVSAPRTIPKVRKLIFVADYDGSWQSYLEDFITLSPQGATAIWSNALGFPRTRFLILDGAADGDRFKRWGRRQMIPTRFWYSAYPQLTSEIIRVNAAIRCGLEAQALTESQAEAWLKLFGSAPRPVSEIECEQIQGLALNGYRSLLEGVMIALTFPDDTEACRAWLASVNGQISFGDSEPGDSAMAVALSARGLTRLGLAASNPLAAQFSPAFSMGMANSARSHALGDVANDPSGEVADNSPEAWQWGGPLKPVVDAVLLIYAVNQEKLQTRFDAEKKRWEDAKMPPPQEIVLHRWPPSRDHKTRLPVPITEPFGFVDGISQPSIKGLLSARAALANDRLEPGEFILGYPDGRHQFSPTPQVFAYDDPGGLLPDLPPGFPLDPDGWSVRDLGRNGSYLVIRQLKQEIAKYRDYVNKAATQFPEWSWGAPDWVAAKMLGRWPNGAPLALFPDGPPGPDDYCPIAKDENFRFGRDDPQGLACPFGAHIRRANPRDQFDADDKTQMSITNRHRILRRGRAYVDGKDSGADAQGLLFMCLNADIERQFEFLQQGWVGSSSFGPLRREADPLTATNRKGGTYTIPTLAGPKQLTGMQSFVSVIGGGYFFLPGRRALEFLAT